MSYYLVQLQLYVIVIAVRAILDGVLVQLLTECRLW